MIGRFTLAWQLGNTNEANETVLPLAGHLAKGITPTWRSDTMLEGAEMKIGDLTMELEGSEMVSVSESSSLEYIFS